MTSPRLGAATDQPAGFDEMHRFFQISRDQFGETNRDIGILDGNDFRRWIGRWNDHVRSSADIYSLSKIPISRFVSPN